AGLECGQIGLIHILLGYNRIEAVSQTLRSGVYCEVLCTSRGFEIVFILALQPLDEPHAETACQIRVFSVGLMPASPARITEDIHVWRPEGETLVDIRVAEFLLHVVLRTAFRRDGVSD